MSTDHTREAMDAIADVDCGHRRAWSMCATCVAEAVRPTLERVVAERDALKAELAATKAAFDRAWEVHGEICSESELAEARAAIERLTAEWVWAEHFACRPHRCGDEASGIDGNERCHGCRRVWPCPTIAALNAPAQATTEETNDEH